MDSPTTNQDPADQPDSAPQPGGDERSGPASQMPAHPLSDAPHLSTLAALGALLAMLLHRLVVPGFSQGGDRAMWLEIERWGDFGANLSAVCGIIALIAGVRGFVAHNHHLSGGKRFNLLFFTVVFVGTIGAATVMDRAWTSAEMVWLAVGEANVLCVVLSVSALSLSPGRQTRGLALAMACMVLFGLTARILERAAVSLSSWIVQLRSALEAVGEVGYIVVLLLGAYWMVPRAERVRDNIARLIGLSSTGMLGAAFIIAISRAPQDYRLLLYHSQRVRLLIDDAPQLYAFPICAALGAAVSATLGSDRVRRQAGTGMLLLLAAGFAPRAPGGLLALTLAVCLMSRATLAASWQVRTPEQRATQ